ncbi:hypothetical protein VTH06DRAFT_5172 [Thermothelomyces fergusii]
MQTKPEEERSLCTLYTKVGPFHMPNPPSRRLVRRSISIRERVRISNGPALHLPSRYTWRGNKEEKKKRERKGKWNDSTVTPCSQPARHKSLLMPPF